MPTNVPSVLYRLFARSVQRIGEVQHIWVCSPEDTEVLEIEKGEGEEVEFFTIKVIKYTISSS